MSLSPHDNDTSIDILKSSLKSKGARRQYVMVLKRFFSSVSLGGGILDDQAQEFITRAKNNPEWARQGIIKFLLQQNDRVENGEMSSSTVENYFKPIKSFCLLSDIPLNWKIFRRFIPDGPNVADDRAPQLDEIQRLLKDSDPRIKPMVLVMVSSGMSEEAWEYLKFGHIKPEIRDGQIIAAKMAVNVGKKNTKKRHRYITFITPEAWNALEEWKNFRESWGENVTDDSWVVRDRWPTTNIKHGIRGLATIPKKLTYDAIQRVFDRAMCRQRLRQPLPDGVRRHPWKRFHGFRKWFKTQAEGAGMKTLYVETLMGHNTKLSAHYFRPDDFLDKSLEGHERLLLEDYLKAVPYLTINESTVIKEQLKKRMDSKDQEVLELKEQMTKMNDLVSELYHAVEFYKPVFVAEMKRLNPHLDPSGFEISPFNGETTNFLRRLGMKET